ncbi:MAG: HisA/HisF-related TIM barrel protein, partial [Fimbriiglobus sp.]
HGGTNAILSVDLWDGRWIGDWEPWRNHGIHENSDIIEIAEAMISEFYASSLLFLDLTRVGEARGPGTEHWVKRARDHFDGIDIVTGGGVGNWDDVKRLEDAGADAVLVASGLHDGTLTGMAAGG